MHDPGMSIVLRDVATREKSNGATAINGIVGRRINPPEWNEITEIGYAFKSYMSTMEIYCDWQCMYEIHKGFVSNIMIVVPLHVLL